MGFYFWLCLMFFALTLRRINEHGGLGGKHQYDEDEEGSGLQYDNPCFWATVQYIYILA